MEQLIKELESRARTLRYRIVKMIGPEEKGHLGVPARSLMWSQPSISTKCAMTPSSRS